MQKEVAVQHGKELYFGLTLTFTKDIIMIMITIPPVVLVYRMKDQKVKKEGLFFCKSFIIYIHRHRQHYHRYPI